jgi:hypothetical protein
MRLASATILMCLSASALSVAEEDHCRDVLEYAGRNETTLSYESSRAYALYENHCQDEKFDKTKSRDISLEAVVKQVPAKFGYHEGDNEARMNHFCKTFASDLHEHSVLYDRRSTVVADAVRAWENCLGFTNKGILFRPQILPTRFVIAAGRTSLTTPASIKSVSVDPALLTCTAPGDRNQGAIAVGPQTTKDLGDEEWAITCVRKGTPSATKGVTNYPAADIIVGTSVGGSFTLRVATDAEITQDRARDYEIRIAACGSKDPVNSTVTARGDVLFIGNPDSVIVPGSDQRSALEVPLHVLSPSTRYTVAVEYSVTAPPNLNSSVILGVIRADGSGVSCTEMELRARPGSPDTPGKSGMPPRTPAECAYGTWYEPAAKNDFADTFQLSGLRPGDYIVRAEHYIGGGGQPQRTFSGARRISVVQEP